MTNNQVRKTVDQFVGWPNVTATPRPVIEVETREVYGAITVYPFNERAKLICRLTGCKTLRHTDITTCRELGFEIVDRTTSKVPA